MNAATMTPRTTNAAKVRFILPPSPLHGRRARQLELKPEHGCLCTRCRREQERRQRRHANHARQASEPAHNRSPFAIWPVGSVTRLSPSLGRRIGGGRSICGRRTVASHSVGPLRRSRRSPPASKPETRSPAPRPSSLRRWRSCAGWQRDCIQACCPSAVWRAPWRHWRGTSRFLSRSRSQVTGCPRRWRWLPISSALRHLPMSPSTPAPQASPFP
jgi:hypothetical protein